MNLFVDKHIELLKALLKNNVDFIIIGGYSVIFHGYKRTTGDVDIWVKPDNTNKEKVLLALKEIKIDSNSIGEIGKLDFTGYVVFCIWEEPERADFITRINLVNYDAADKNKIIGDMDGVKIPFLHLNDLVLSKMNTGRGKDIADIEELQKIQKLS